jgi:DNA-binding protein HU-beta
MDKKELLEHLTLRTGADKKHLEEILDAALDEIYLSLKRGESVSLRHFGTFYVRPERSSTVFKFTPSQKWKAMLGWSSTYRGEL